MKGDAMLRIALLVLIVSWAPLPAAAMPNATELLRVCDSTSPVHVQVCEAWLMGFAVGSWTARNTAGMPIAESCLPVTDAATMRRVVLEFFHRLPTLVEMSPAGTAVALAFHEAFPCS